MLGGAIMQTVTSSIMLADWKNDARIKWQSTALTPSDAPFVQAGECLVLCTPNNGCIQIAWKNPNNFDGFYGKVYWSNIDKWSGWIKITGTSI